MARLTTSNGRDYSFSFERQSDGTIRAYITGQPDYGSQSTAASDTHRKGGADGRYYIDWPEPLYLEAEAKEAAGEWAKRNDLYIDTGNWVPYKKIAQEPLAHDELPSGAVSDARKWRGKR
jgi:hypothetical protein